MFNPFARNGTDGRLAPSFWEGAVSQESTELSPYVIIIFDNDNGDIVERMRVLRIKLVMTCDLVHLSGWVTTLLGPVRICTD
jgi:hypothetical protein